MCIISFIYVSFSKYIDEKIESCQFPFLNIPLKLLKIPYKHSFKSSNKFSPE